MGKLEFTTYPNRLDRIRGQLDAGNALEIDADDIEYMLYRIDVLTKQLVIYKEYAHVK